MFSHLKAEEFVNLLEGEKLSSSRRAHLAGCASCSATWQSMQSMHAGFSSVDDGIIEPDWKDFRSSVRDELLSRSVQRDSLVRRWTGWRVRPAVAWALTVLMTVGITSGALLWWTNRELPANLTESLTMVDEPVLDSNAVPEPGDFNHIENEIDLWSQKDVFDELAQLEESQEEALRVLLQAAQDETAVRE